MRQEMENEAIIRNTYGFVNQQLREPLFGENACFRQEKEAMVVMEIPSDTAEELLFTATEKQDIWKERQGELCRKLDCNYLLFTWQEQEEERLLFLSRSMRVRALEFLDFLIGEFGLVKGDGTVATGRISSVVLKVQMSGEDIESVAEYFLQRSTAYFEDCDWIDAGVYVEKNYAQFESMRYYEKKPFPWAYVKSTEIAEPGEHFFIKSLENESGLVIEANENTYIMIGCRGEVYDISRKKFEATYDASLQALDVFELMLDFLPAVEMIPSGEYVSLEEIAHLCFPKRGKGIHACELKKRTKVFPVNQTQEYFLGHPGDYLAVRADDLQDVYIVQREIFLQTYEEN